MNFVTFDVFDLSLSSFENLDNSIYFLNFMFSNFFESVNFAFFDEQFSTFINDNIKIIIQNIENLSSCVQNVNNVNNQFQFTISSNISCFSTKRFISFDFSTIKNQNTVNFDFLMNFQLFELQLCIDHIMNNYKLNLISKKNCVFKNLECASQKHYRIDRDTNNQINNKLNFFDSCFFFTLSNCSYKKVQEHKRILRRRNSW